MSAIIAISCSSRNEVQEDELEEIAVEEVAMADESPESPQLWTAPRRALVVSILKGRRRCRRRPGSTG
jgi:hypothetical protein